LWIASENWSTGRGLRFLKENLPAMPNLTFSPIFSGELVWELMIIKGNKQKRQSRF